MLTPVPIISRSDIEVSKMALLIQELSASMSDYTRSTNVEMRNQRQQKLSFLLKSLSALYISVLFLGFIASISDTWDMFVLFNIIMWRPLKTTVYPTLFEYGKNRIANA